jgi:hypothetical protein
MHCVISIGRRVRACTRLLVAAKALATRDYVRGISKLSTLPNSNRRRLRVAGYALCKYCLYYLLAINLSTIRYPYYANALRAKVLFTVFIICVTVA